MTTYRLYVKTSGAAHHTRARIDVIFEMGTGSVSNNLLSSRRKRLPGNDDR